MRMIAGSIVLLAGAVLGAASMVAITALSLAGFITGRPRVENLAMPSLLGLIAGGIVMAVGLTIVVQAGAFPSSRTPPPHPLESAPKQPDESE